MQATVEIREPEGVVLRGDLRFATVTAVRDRLERLIATGDSHCTIDFTGVKSVDSSALSLWLCCQREAQRHGVTLEARRVPRELLSIARLVGLESLFDA